MRILIIEDEQYTAKDLADCILDLRPEFRIIRVLRSVKEATEYIRKNQDYDLIFSDIQLGDGLSFDIYDNVKPPVPVIFCTAFNSYAIEAFKANGIDYILKPADKDSIRKAIEKYELLVKPQQNNLDLLLQVMKDRNPPGKNSSSILVHHKDKIIPIKLEDIALFYIQNEICRITDFEGRHFSISENLEKAEKMAGNSFFRANRQFLVNRKAIREVTQGFSRSHNLILTIDFKEAIVVSKEKSAALFRWLTES